ncbi:putative Secreted Protein (WYLE family) [Cryptosporidium felis]|nr:putative Secreted Protein (WYLE family) [Cryptosporidium felis]
MGNVLFERPSNLQFPSKFILNVVLVFTFLSYCFCLRSASSRGDTSSGQKYYKQIISNNILSVVRNLRKIPGSDKTAKERAIIFLSKLYKSEDFRTALNGDIVNLQVPDSLENKNQMDNSGLVHVASEFKKLSIFRKLKIEYEKRNVLLDKTATFHFPRVRHYRNHLPIITPEPYQRVMSFSIEVCMIPSIWYLELIHCMFMSSARFYTGIMMSYSLQDLVGSAIMTIGYEDEKFSLENCYYSVSLVADDVISRNYKIICEEMEECLRSNSFTGRDFSPLVKEFEKRITRVYSYFDKDEQGISALQFAKLSLLYSVSFVKTSKRPQAFHPERNFLPIRIMLAALVYFGVSNLFSYQVKKQDIVRGLAKFISSSMFRSLELNLLNCPFEMGELAKERSQQSYILFDFFCMEIFSTGFVEEKVVVIEDSELFKKATKPSRVLLPMYASVIPRMSHDLNIEEYDREWLRVAEPPQQGPETQELQKQGSEDREDRYNRSRKIYKSRLLKKTRKRNPKGIGNTLQTTRPDTQKHSSHTNRVGLFPGNRRRMNSISRRVLGE